MAGKERRKDRVEFFWFLDRRRMAWNAGLGVGTTDETLRVYFARDLRAKRSPLQVTVRIARSY